MSSSLFLLVAFFALVCMTYAQPYIGPASFAWPLPRQWNRTFENVPPCGLSVQGHRSKFPMHSGYVVFVSEYETVNLEVKVAYTLNPKSVADFAPLVPWYINKYGVGFACIKVPNAPSDVYAGTNATFQLRFASDYDTPNHRSFFVCADITYVDPGDVDFPFPCVNTTDVDVEFERLPLPKKKKPDVPKPKSEEWSPGEKKKVLSTAAIAGIAMGAAVVFSGIAILIFRKVTKSREQRRRDEVPCRWVPGSYGLPDLVPIRNFFYARPTRRG